MAVMKEQLKNTEKDTKEFYKQKAYVTFLSGLIAISITVANKSCKYFAVKLVEF